MVDGARLTLFELLCGTRHTLLVMPGINPGADSLSSALRAQVEEVAKAYGDWVRVCFVLSEQATAEASVAAPVTIVCDLEGALHRRYGAADGRMYLIRPDGYIGFRGESSDLEALRRHLTWMFPNSKRPSSGLIPASG